MSDKASKKSVTKALTLKDLEDFANKSVGNQIINQCLGLKVKIGIEIKTDGGMEIVLQNQDGSIADITFSDLKRSFAIAPLIRKSMEKVGDVGPAEEVYKNCSYRIVENGGTKTDVRLIGNNKVQAAILGKWFAGYKKINESLAEAQTILGKDAHLDAYKVLLDLFKSVLADCHNAIQLPAAVNLEKELIPKLCEKYGIPIWFFNTQIKRPSDVCNVLGTYKPYRLFFAPDGKSGCYLLSKEMTNKLIITNLCDIGENQFALVNLVERIRERKDKMGDLVYFVPTPSEEEYFENLRWNLIPTMMNWTDFLKLKEERKTCDAIPFGTSTYKSIVDRIHAAFTRAFYLEGPTGQTTCELFYGIFKKEEFVRLPVGVSIYSRVLEEPNFEASINNAFSFKGKYADFYSGTLQRVIVTGISTYRHSSVSIAAYDAMANLPFWVGTQNEARLIAEGELKKTKRYIEETDTSKRDGMLANIDLTLIFKVNNNDYYVRASALGPRIDPDYLRIWTSEHYPQDGDIENMPHDKRATFNEILERFKLVPILEEKPEVVFQKYLMTAPVKELIRANKKTFDCVKNVEIRNGFYDLVRSYRLETHQHFIAELVIGSIDRYIAGDVEDDATTNDEDLL